MVDRTLTSNIIWVRLSTVCCNTIKINDVKKYYHSKTKVDNVDYDVIIAYDIKMSYIS